MNIQVVDYIENSVSDCGVSCTSNKGKITFVGSEFESDNQVWQIQMYNPEIDEFWIAKSDKNTSAVSAAWVSAKWFRKAWIDGDIKILDKWWLPK